MSSKSNPVRVVVMGAAGRDFHNFNVVYRDDPGSEVVAFTATQIPDIAGRRYPAELAGARYPSGIPIVDESDLAELCRDERVDEVIFAYSDVPHQVVMHRASEALAAGASFKLMGPRETMLRAAVPVIATSAVRTGCGKSQVTRWLASRLRKRGLRVVAIRHPMPYGDLARQAVQRFATQADLDEAECTVEEREEYEPHLEMGNVIYAGVDYGRIVARAEREADILLWDGGNNDFPFLAPDLHIVLVDPLRAGHEETHHPGEAVLRMADVAVLVKTDAASAHSIARVSENVRRLNPRAAIVRGTSPVTLDDASLVAGKRVLIIEDGPTITHGGMAYGAGYVAATAAGAHNFVDPRPFAHPEIAAVFERYPHIGAVLPALGYSAHQLAALRQTIEATPADVVVSGTPCDLARLIALDKPVLRARYEFADAQGPAALGACIDAFVAERLGKPE